MSLGHLKNLHAVKTGAWKAGVNEKKALKESERNEMDHARWKKNYYSPYEIASQSEGLL